ncbi:MAG: hypothetical protein ACI831_001873 [Candidatus Azotimanducaceae bacterium]|jgi:hypothetical protein
MSTLRHYFVSNNLDDLESLERELESAGINRSRIHVLSHDDVGLAEHRTLNSVKSLFRNDAVHSGVVGAEFGAITVIGLMGLVYFMGWHQAVGWLPFWFLAIVIFGFCTWEGGLIGIQRPNVHYTRFQDELDAGNHVFIVEMDSAQQRPFEVMLSDHPDLKAQGTEIGVPHWIFNLQQRLFAFVDRNLLSYKQETQN